MRLPHFGHDQDSTCLVFLLELHDHGQVRQRPLHRVQSLDDEQDLLPRTVGARHALADALAQQRLELLHVVVLVLADVRATETRTEADGAVVVFVRDDERSGSGDGGDGGGVGGTCGADSGIGGDIGGFTGGETGLADEVLGFRI